MPRQGLARPTERPLARRRQFARDGSRRHAAVLHQRADALDNPLLALILDHAPGVIEPEAERGMVSVSAPVGAQMAHRLARVLASLFPHHLREHGQHPDHGAPHGRPGVDALGEAHNLGARLLQPLDRRHGVLDRPGQARQVPYHNHTARRANRIQRGVYAGAVGHLAAADALIREHAADRRALRRCPTLDCLTLRGKAHALIPLACGADPDVAVDGALSHANIIRPYWHERKAWFHAIHALPGQGFGTLRRGVQPCNRVRVGGWQRRREGAPPPSRRQVETRRPASAFTISPGCLSRARAHARDAFPKCRRPVRVAGALPCR